MVGGRGRKENFLRKIWCSQAGHIGEGGGIYHVYDSKEVTIILITYKLARKTERRKMDQEVAIHRKQM